MKERNKRRGDVLDRSLSKIGVEEAPADYYDTLWSDLKKKIAGERREEKPRIRGILLVPAFGLAALAIALTVTALLNIGRPGNKANLPVQAVTNKRTDTVARVESDKSQKSISLMIASISVKGSADVLTLTGEADEIISSIGSLNGEQQEKLIAILDQEIADEYKADDYEF